MIATIIFEILSQFAMNCVIYVITVALNLFICIAVVTIFIIKAAYTVCVCVHYQPIVITFSFHNNINRWEKEI